MSKFFLNISVLCFYNSCRVFLCFAAELTFFLMDNAKLPHFFVPLPFV